MRREDGSDHDLLEGGNRILGRNSSFLQAQQRSTKRARERLMFAIQLARATPALAVVGLGKIGEFEIRREGLRDLVGARQVHRRNDRLRLMHECGRRSLLGMATRRLTMLNQQPPQLFHRFEQILTGLLDQRLS